MIPSNFTVTISASSVAWYGAIVSTMALLLNFLNYWDSRVQILVTVRKGYRVYPAVHPYKQDTNYVVVTVINKGRRPVTIGIVGWKGKRNEQNGILSDSLIYLRDT